MSFTRRLRILFGIMATLVAFGVAFPSASSVWAISVTMTADDANGATTSINGAGKWNNSAAPSAGNNYFSSNRLVRTPTTATTVTFGGDSLSIDSGGRLVGKNTVATQTINFTNGAGLILNGGVLDMAGTSSDTNTLVIAGTITVTADSQLGAFGTNTINNNTNFETLHITGVIGGNAGLTVATAANNGGEGGVVKLSAANTYGGTITVAPPTNGTNAISSQVNRLLQLNNLNALQNATLSLTLTNSQPNLVSFASAVNLGTFNVGALGGAANQALTDTAGGNVTLNVGANNGNTTYSGVLSGGGSLIKSGNGTMVLSGSNTYTGTTTINGGKLVVTGSASTSAVAVNSGTLDGIGPVGNTTVASAATNKIANGNGGIGTLTLNSLAFSGNATVDARVSNVIPIRVTNGLTTTLGSQVTINPAGPFLNGLNNLIGYNNWTGSLSDFTLGAVSGLNARQSASGLAINGNNVAVNILGDTLKWTGLDSTSWLAGATGPNKNWTLAAGAAATDYIENDIVLFDDSAPGVGPIAVDINSGNVSPNQTEFNNSAKDYVLGGGFGISTGYLIKSGTGAVTINTTNSHPYGTTFNGGTLNIGNSSALGTGSITIGAGSAKTLDNTSGVALVFSPNAAQSWNDDLTFAGAADSSHDLDMGTGTVTLGGTGADRTITVNGASILAIGEFKGGAALGLIKNGTGTLALTSKGVDTAGSTLAGVLNVAAGTVQINHTGFSTGAETGDFVTAGLIGSGTITNGSGFQRSFYVDTAGNHTFNGSLQNGSTGTLGFLKRGSGTQTLAGTNSYTSNTRVDAGMLVITGNNSGTGTNAQVNAGTLVLAHPNALGTTSAIRLSGDNVSTLSYATDGSDTLYSLLWSTGVNATIVSNRATPGAGINHTITTQTGSSGLGGGTITINSGANVNMGMGRITFDALNLSAGSVQTTTLNPMDANVSVGPVTKAANNFAQTLGLAGNTANNFVTGVISNGANAAQVISVSKTGSSTWTLLEANTYTGLTTVTGGTLLVNNTLGSGTGTGGVSVSGGGTLGGTGIIDTTSTNTGVNIGAGGNLAPGVSSAGTLKMSLGSGFLDVSAVTAGGLKFELGAPATLDASDQVVLNSGTLNIGAGALNFSDFTFTNLGGVAVGTYKLFDANSTIAGTIGTATGSFGGFAATLSMENTTAFDIILTVTGPASLPGDYNNDNKVDAADYVIWRKDPDAHGGTPDGYNTWRANFGNSLGSGSSLPGAGGAVPEPSTCLLVCLGSMALIATRRRPMQACA